jgi:hypothetical protein
LAFYFEYKGGVEKPTEHSTEKFLVFLVAGGNEMAVWDMEREGLVENKGLSKSIRGGVEYSTGINIVKVFLAQSGFGIQRRFYSIYLRLLQGPAAEVTIRPFTEDLNFFFKAQAEVLTSKQALNILSPDSSSRRFVARQSPLPVKIMERILTIDRSRQREGVRKVRFGGQHGGD